MRRQGSDDADLVIMQRRCRWSAMVWRLEATRGEVLEASGLGLRNELDKLNWNNGADQTSEPT